MQNRSASEKEKVAIIGAGPGGLVAAKYLKDHGYEPVLLDRHAEVGGQWDASAADSPVWPTMAANTSRELTCFSDLAYPEGTPVYPSNRDVLAYLRRYARELGLLEHFRPQTTVESLERDNGGWQVRSRGADGAERAEHFDRVIVASGRYHAPSVPEIPGLASFSGAGGVLHSSDYQGVEAFRGKRVLVLGASISAVEIASDLALGGAREVLCASRRQRYVLQKMWAGVPCDQVVFSRFSALAAESFPPEAAAHGLKEMIVRNCGSPEQFGAPPPHENVFAAGITQSQHYLACVAEGRIQPRGWPTRIEGSTVHFGGGSSTKVDAIIFATGFRLDLPFLGEELRRVLHADAHNLDLFQFTFHPELPGLAFLGMYCLVGPHLPVLELQARAIVYAWRGLRPMHSKEEMEQALAASRGAGGGAVEVPMPMLAVLFAREAGAEPDLAADPELLAALAFGPLTPISFRITGPDRLPDAAARAAASARAAVRSAVLAPEQAGALQALAGARRDDGLARAAQAASKPR